MESESLRGQQNQQLDNLISCAICLEYFVDPRILPCSHTYCLRCIHKTASNNRGRFECPMRDGTKVERDHIDSLPINRIVRDMVDVLPNVVNTNERSGEASRPQCCECLSATADFWCSDCAVSYCAACCTNTHKGRIASQHRRMPIEEKPVDLKRCDKHRDEKLKYWCSCETLICLDCQLSKQHKDHSPVPIVEVVLDTTEKLRAGFEEAQKFLSQTIQKGMLLKSGNENSNMQSITRSFDTLRETINNYEKALKNQIRAIEEKNKMLAENYLTLLNTKQTTLSNHNKDFERILSAKDHAQLLESKRRLTEYLEQLTKELQELEPPIKTEYRIEGVDGLQANISDILKQACIVEQKPGNRFDHT